MQAEINLITAEQGSGVVKEIGVGNLFSTEIERSWLWEKEIRQSKPDVTDMLELGKDVVFTWPWNRNRYIENLCHFSTRQPEGSVIPWKEDYNHYVTQMLPWRIYLVGTGNHSMLAGVATGRGRVTPRVLDDSSWLLSKYHTDGKFWYDSQSKKKLERVKNYRGAAVFEIGRLLPNTPS